MSGEPIAKLPVRRIGKDDETTFLDAVAVERPLTALVNGNHSFRFLRSPGQEEALAAGSLFCLGVVMEPSDILRFETSLADEEEILNVWLSDRASVRLESHNQFEELDPSFYPAARSSPFLLSPRRLRAIHAELEQAQPVFRETGATHAVGLFTAQGKCLALAEDVGRANAACKVIGTALLAGTLEQAQVAVTTSRAGFEVIRRLAKTPVAFIAAVGAPTTRSVDLCRDLNVTLVAFLRQQAMNVYTHPERISETATCA